MQNVSFICVEECLESLPDNELEMVLLLRELVFSCIPGVTEKLSYNVPFYRKHKSICFIWPASILWGKKQSFEGVRLGFSYGYLLTDDISYLDRGARKQIFWKDFKMVREINIDLIKPYLFEASLIDKEMANLKNSK